MKKKFLVIAFVALFSTSLYAQTQTANADLKNGTHNVEVMFSPFKSDGSTFAMPNFGFRYRYFFGENALRVNLNAGFNSTKEGEKQVATASDKLDWVGTKDAYSLTKSSSFKIALGYERHFDICNRVSMYAGAELGYDRSRSRTNEWRDDNYTENQTTYAYAIDKKVVDPANNSIVLSAIAGADFYVYKGIYLGMELGLRYKHTFAPAAERKISGTETGSYTSGGVTISRTTTYEGNKTTIVTVRDGQTTTTETFTPETTSYNSGSSFNFFVEPMLRIGWRF